MRWNIPRALTHLGKAPVCQSRCCMFNSQDFKTFVNSRANGAQTTNNINLKLIHTCMRGVLFCNGWQWPNMKASGEPLPPSGQEAASGLVIMVPRAISPIISSLLHERNAGNKNKLMDIFTTNIIKVSKVYTYIFF